MSIYVFFVLLSLTSMIFYTRREVSEKQKILLAHPPLAHETAFNPTFRKGGFEFLVDFL